MNRPKEKIYGWPLLAVNKGFVEIEPNAQKRLLEKLRFSLKVQFRFKMGQP